MKKLIFNLFTIFLKVGCTELSFNIQQVLILENNFWGEYRIQTKTDKGFLTDVKIKIINVNSFHLVDKCLRKYCFFDKEKQKQCFLLNSNLSDIILSNIKNGKRLILKIQYTYANYELVYEGSLGRYVKNLKHYDDFKILGKDVDGIIRFEENGIESYLSHIKSIFSKIVDSGFIVLENFDLAVEKYLNSRAPNLRLHYFKSFSECVQNFKNFMNYFNFQNFDDESLSLKPNMSYSNNYNASYLQNYLKTKFDLDYKEGKEFDTKFQNINDCIELLFKGCYDELEQNLLPSYILLPFKDTFTIDFYFDKFYCLIKEVIEEMVYSLDTNHVTQNVEFRELILNFRNKTINMYEKLIIDSWESLNATKYFSDLFEREIKNLNDFIEIDNVMCDYYNVISCLNGNKYNLKESEINFTNPMFNDEFEYRLVKALQIKMQGSNKLGEIIAYDFEESKNQLIENVDYFVINSQEIVNIVILFKKTIKTIEIISKNRNFKKKILINKYLN